MDEVSKIGKISKQWTGLLREAFTDTDNFGIQFPMDLDVKMKAVMIGACFLIVSEIHLPERNKEVFHMLIINERFQSLSLSMRTMSACGR